MKILITDPAAVMGQILTAIGAENLTDGAGRLGFRYAHAQRLSTGKHILSVGSLERIAAENGITFQIGNDPQVETLTAANCKKAYDAAGFKDFHALQSVSGLGYTTGWKLTQEIAPKVRIDTILKFGKACKVSFTIGGSDAIITNQGPDPATDKKSA